jgi:hypothetical protein
MQSNHEASVSDVPERVGPSVFTQLAAGAPKIDHRAAVTNS